MVLMFCEFWEVNVTESNLTTDFFFMCNGISKDFMGKVLPVLEKGTDSTLQMTAHKLESLKTISGMILNQLQPKFAAKTVANEM